MEKPTFKQKVDSFCKFVWNGETSQFLGRGGRSWAEIGFFYLIYYICLAGFFCATIAVFYETIDVAHPRLQGTDSLLKGNPGMGFQPMPDIDTTLVRSTKAQSEAKHIKAMVKSFDKVLEAYMNQSDANTIDCNGMTETREKDTTSCKVDFAKLTEKCNKENDYGMRDQKPCVLLKLNRIFGWKPQLWEAGSDKIPKEIKEDYQTDKIMVYCHGENPADEDNIGLGQIKYYPSQGFPLAFYPYKKQENYLSPLIFVQFENATRHLGLMVECKAFARNIEVDQQEKQGSVHFELLND